MVYLIPKLEMPVLQYTPVKYKDDVAMLGISPNGPVVLFTATDELIFVPYDEIIELAATAERKQPPAKPEEAKTSPPGTPRVIKERTKEH